MAPLLELRTVCKSYGALVVTDALDLAVERGEALGVIGPNGAGKTTMFNLITGTTAPDTGQVIYKTGDITGLPAARRCHLGITRSFQIPQPFSGMTVFENMLVGASFGARLANTEAEDACVAALDLTGLWPKANTRAGALTLLERKRLELARSLSTKPDLLLLDEIAGGLTEGECRELVNSIREIRSSGVTIIWIEHVVHALLAVVDRLMVIDFGRKIADGDPHPTMESDVVREIYIGIDADA